MTTIPRTLLNAKGTIDAVFALAFNQDDATVAEMGEYMEVSRGTARARLDTLAEQGVFTETAALRNGRAVRVFEITEDGVELAHNLNDVVDETITEPTGEDPDGTTDVANDETELNEQSTS
jgi:predicted ArsR family transcriptional regulator